MIFVCWYVKLLLLLSINRFGKHVTTEYLKQYKKIIY